MKPSPWSAAPVSATCFCAGCRGEEGLTSPVSLTGGEGTFSVKEDFLSAQTAAQESFFLIQWSLISYLKMLLGVSDILTVEQLSSGSRLCVSLSIQLLLQLNVQLSGVKGRSAESKFGILTGLTCLETHKQVMKVIVRNICAGAGTQSKFQRRKMSLQVHTANSYLCVCLCWLHTLCGTPAAHTEESGPCCGFHRAAAGERLPHAGVCENTHRCDIFTKSTYQLTSTSTPNRPDTFSSPQVPQGWGAEGRCFTSERTLHSWCV